MDMDDDAFDEFVGHDPSSKLSDGKEERLQRKRERTWVLCEKLARTKQRGATIFMKEYSTMKFGRSGRQHHVYLAAQRRKVYPVLNPMRTVSVQGPADGEVVADRVWEPSSLTRAGLRNSSSVFTRSMQKLWKRQITCEKATVDDLDFWDMMDDDNDELDDKQISLTKPQHGRKNKRSRKQGGRASLVPESSFSEVSTSETETPVEKNDGLNPQDIRKDVHQRRERESAPFPEVPIPPSVPEAPRTGVKDLSSHPPTHPTTPPTACPPPSGALSAAGEPLEDPETQKRKQRLDDDDLSHSAPAHKRARKRNCSI